MRYAIVSDIHANWAALNAVIQDATAAQIDAFWCLGDVVGYGPHPEECVHFLHDRVDHNQWVIGNHDAGLIGLMTTADFSAEARAMLEIHRAILQHPTNQGLWEWCQAQMTEVRTNPRSSVHGDIKFVLVHACLTPDHYVGRTSASYLYPWNSLLLRWNGLDPLRDTHLEENGCACMLYGHTHIPTFAEVMTRRRISLRSIRYNHPLPLNGQLLAINPGSVGQPRDGDQRAAYAIIDTDDHTVEFRRVAYDLTQLLQLMADRAYPHTLYERLRLAGNPADHQSLAEVYQRTVDGLEAI